SSQNPLPASFQVDVRNLPDVAAVSGSYGGDPAVDPSYPTSYQADVYRGLQTFVEVGGAVVIVVLAALALVSAAVTANAIRAGLDRLAGKSPRPPIVNRALLLATALAVAGLATMQVQAETTPTPAPTPTPSATDTPTPTPTPVPTSTPTPTPAPNPPTATPT